jgi:hypothetical protein
MIGFPVGLFGVPWSACVLFCFVAAELQNYACLSAMTAGLPTRDVSVRDFRQIVIPLKTTRMIEITTWPRGLGSSTLCMLTPNPNVTSAQHESIQMNLGDLFEIRDLRDHSAGTVTPLALLLAGSVGSGRPSGNTSMRSKRALRFTTFTSRG